MTFGALSDHSGPAFPTRSIVMSSTSNDTNTTTQNASASSDQNQSGNQSNRNNNTGVATRPSHRGMRRRDPFSVFNDMEMMMDRMLGGRLPLLRAFPNAQGADGGWAPQVDIYEQDNNLIVNAELPGVKRDDLNVTLDQGDLVIQGERK